jgi:hypothetical protein
VVRRLNNQPPAKLLREIGVAVLQFGQEDRAQF